MMTEEHTEALLCLAKELELPQTLEEMLQRVAARTAALCATSNASIWLLDASRTRLLVGCRAGAPFHADPNFEFRLGEGLLGWVAQHSRVLSPGDAPRDPRLHDAAGPAAIDAVLPRRAAVLRPLLHRRAQRRPP